MTGATMGKKTPEKKTTTARVGDGANVRDALAIVERFFSLSSSPIESERAAALQKVKKLIEKSALSPEMKNDVYKTVLVILEISIGARETAKKEREAEAQKKRVDQARKANFTWNCIAKAVAGCALLATSWFAFIQGSSGAGYALAVVAVGLWFPEILKSVFEERTKEGLEASQ